MKKESDSSHTVETGGILIGYISERGKYIIIKATEPGPKATKSSSGIDIKSLTEIAQQANYRIELPILIILSPSFEFALTITRVQIADPFPTINVF